MDVAVVTGANAGIGRATAVHLAGQGMTVYGTMRSVAKADKLLAMADEHGVTVELAELDVADDESVRAGFADIFARAGRVDHLVNNAGVGGNAVLEECPPSLYSEVFNVNVTGVARCTQQVLPRMRARGAGTIVNITSVAGRSRAGSRQSPTWRRSGRSKASRKDSHRRLAPFGIRVAIVEPGVTKSSIFAKNIDAPNQSGAYDAHYRRMFQLYAAGNGCTPPIRSKWRG